MFSTLNSGKFDRPQPPLLALVVTRHAGDLVQRTIDRKVHHALDEAQVAGIGGRRAGEVARLLDHRAFRMEKGCEVLLEPVADVDGVDLHVAECVALDLFAGCFALCHDGVEASAFGDEERHVAALVHDPAQAVCLGFQIEGHFRQVNAVDVLHRRVHHQLLDIFIVLGTLDVLARRGRCQPPAMPAHDLVDDKGPRCGTLFIADMVEEMGADLRSRPGAQGLPDRHDVVVDRFRQADHGQVVTIAGEVCGEVRGRRVGVVAANGVENGDAIFRKAVGCDLQRVGAFLDKAALHAVRRIGELDPAVADRRPAIAMEQMGALADVRGDVDPVTLEQALVAGAVGNQFDLRRNIGVALDQSTDGR